MTKTKILPFRNFVVTYDEIKGMTRSRKNMLLLASTQKEAISYAQETNKLAKKNTANYTCSKAGRLYE